MPWNGSVGTPWAMWEKDLLIRERQKSPPTPYKEIVKQLPGRTWRAAHREATDLALTSWSNSETHRIKYKDREGEIFATLQYCVLDRKMNISLVRDYLENVKGIKLARSTLGKRVAKMKDGTPEEREVHNQAHENATRSRGLRISLTRRAKYKRGDYDHMRVGGGKTYGNSRSKGEEQDQGDTEEVQLLLRTASNAGDGTERHA